MHDPLVTAENGPQVPRENKQQSRQKSRFLFTAATRFFVGVSCPSSPAHVGVNAVAR